MDIFTTQLTRVVPVPIKPANLKVKALLKEAASSKLTQDSDHLENHECYFAPIEDEYHGEAKQNNQDTENELEQALNVSGSKDQDSASEIVNKKQKSDNNRNTKHLDLYA